jgi:hypothetical protein
MIYDIHYIHQILTEYSLAFHREKCCFELPYLMMILLSHVMLHLIFLFMWVVYFCGIKFSLE